MTDFYQSPADKLRFEILLKSLREGSLNLAIVGDDEVALANYARQIYDHLNESGEDYVEWWSSADSEKLVQRFNDILSELTVDEALDKSQKRSPKRYMIFPDYALKLRIVYAGKVDQKSAQDILEDIRKDGDNDS